MGPCSIESRIETVNQFAMANVCQLFPITGNYQTLFQHQIKIQYNSPLLTKYLAFIPPITMDSKIQTTTFLKSSIRLAGFLRLTENLVLP